MKRLLISILKWLIGEEDEITNTPKAKTSTFNLKNFAKVFDTEYGQLLIKKDYPETDGEDFCIHLINQPMVGLEVKITISLKSEQEMDFRFDNFTEAEASKHIQDINKLL